MGIGKPDAHGRPNRVALCKLEAEQLRVRALMRELRRYYQR